MNKAFVRESDDVVTRCPRCDAPGVPVGSDTLRAKLTDAQLQSLPVTAFFCAFPRCEVAYFDEFGRTVPAADLSEPVYPKNLDAPLCPCFGLTLDDIEQDIAEGVVTRTRRVVDLAKTDAAHCTVKNPSGQPCVAEVQKTYMKLRAKQ